MGVNSQFVLTLNRCFIDKKTMLRFAAQIKKSKPENLDFEIKAEGLEPLRGPLAVPKICCSLSASPNFDCCAIITSLLLAPRALR